MRIPLALLVGTLALLAGCSGSTPCTACPKIEGRYAMTYKAISSESPDCATLPAPAGPSMIEITRSGAEIRSTLNGLPGRGMLQDSSDFSISAQEEPDGGTDAGTQTVTLRGYFVPPLAKGDGGEPGMINGKWVTHTERGALVCDAEQPVTGVKL